jgi:hypothetical protein
VRYTVKYRLLRLGDLATFVHGQYDCFVSYSLFYKLTYAGDERRDEDIAILQKYAHQYIHSIEGYSGIVRRTLNHIITDLPVTIWRTAANFSPLIFPCYLLLTFVWFPLTPFLLTSGLFGCVMTCFVLFGLL